MSEVNLFLKVVVDINEAYADRDGEPLTMPLEFCTDGGTAVICYGRMPLVNNEEWTWAAEEEGDPRYGKSEYQCLVEDVLSELDDVHTALSSLIVATRATVLGAGK